MSAPNPSHQPPDPTPQDPAAQQRTSPVAVDRSRLDASSTPGYSRGMAPRRTLGKPADLAELLAALAAMSPADRARLGRLLADGKTTKAVGALTDEAVYEMSREASYAEVAAQLGVSASAVNKAITSHRRRLKEGAQG